MPDLSLERQEGFRENSLLNYKGEVNTRHPKWRAGRKEDPFRGERVLTIKKWDDDCDIRLDDVWWEQITFQEVKEQQYIDEFNLDKKGHWGKLEFLGTVIIDKKTCVTMRQPYLEDWSYRYFILL